MAIFGFSGPRYLPVDLEVEAHSLSRASSECSNSPAARCCDELAAWRSRLSLGDAAAVLRTGAGDSDFWQDATVISVSDDLVKVVFAEGKKVHCKVVSKNSAALRPPSHKLREPNGAQLV